MRVGRIFVCFSPTLNGIKRTEVPRLLPSYWNQKYSILVLRTVCKSVYTPESFVILKKYIIFNLFTNYSPICKMIELMFNLWLTGLSIN